MSGFLVEVTPGREQLYPTSWAFRAAMRSGEITPESRILHRLSSQWLPITEHPEYRRFLAQRDPPAWMKPIPLDATEPSAAPDQPAFSTWLAGIRQRVGSTWAAFQRRLEARATSSRGPAATQPKNPPKASSTRNRWTYLP